MSILFICGSCSPGQDGVGDYTRLVAEALSASGQSVAVCALTDRHCTAAAVTGRQPGATSGVSILRIPQTLGWGAKKRALNTWLGAWHPTLVSLQYVPYAFDLRGLPFGLSAWLKAAVPPGVRWHIMFHELWIGITRKSPWKHHLVGAVQKHIGQRLVKKLQPVVCHTSNALYVTILGDAGIRAVRLPLCSSILPNSSEKNWIQGELAAMGVTAPNRNQWWIAGMFGSCYPDVPLEMQVRKVVDDALRMKRKPVFLGIGGGSGTGLVWEGRVRACAPGVRVMHFGRQANAKVSAFLSSLDQGLPNSPREFIGKSSAAAAMWAHGVKLDDSYHVELPEYKGRWDENISDKNLFLSSSQIVERFIEDCKIEKSVRRP